MAMLNSRQSMLDKTKSSVNVTSVRSQPPKWPGQSSFGNTDMPLQSTGRPEQWGQSNLKVAVHTDYMVDDQKAIGRYDDV
jgi:hypothetical protein